MASDQPILGDDQGLPPQQQAFVREYVKDFNGTQAAIRAGYSKKSAGNTANGLLKKPHVQKALSLVIASRNERTEIDAAYVLRQAVKLHERCMQEIKPKLVWDREEKAWIHDTDDEGNALYVFNATGAAKALELVGKHVDVKAFEPDSQVHVNNHLSQLSDEELLHRWNQLQAEKTKKGKK